MNPPFDIEVRIGVTTELPYRVWGESVNARGSYAVQILGSAFFGVTLACFDISSKKRCLYRLCTYHFKAHTISNKLVLKISAQKKGKKSYDSSNMCSIFLWFEV